MASSAAPSCPDTPAPAAAPAKPPRRIRKLKAEASAPATPADDSSLELQRLATPQKGEKAETTPSSPAAPAEEAPASTGQTPVKSPPTKKTRAEDDQAASHGFDTRPTLRLDDCHEISDVEYDVEMFQDRQPDSLEPLPADDQPVVIRPHLWMRSKPFAEMVRHILLEPEYDGEFERLDQLYLWPQSLPMSPLNWASVWRETDFKMPFPYKIGGDDLKNGTLEMMASCARDRMIEAQNYVRQGRILKERLEKVHETTDRLEKAKLAQLEETGKLTEASRAVARESFAQWGLQQKKRHQVDFENSMALYQRETSDTVDQVIRILIFLMESHDLVVRRDEEFDATLLKELEMELDSAMQDVVAATPLDSPVSTPAGSKPDATSQVPSEIPAAQVTPTKSPLPSSKPDETPAGERKAPPSGSVAPSGADAVTWLFSSRSCILYYIYIYIIILNPEL